MRLVVHHFADRRTDGLDGRCVSRDLNRLSGIADLHHNVDPRLLLDVQGNARADVLLEPGYRDFQAVSPG